MPVPIFNFANNPELYTKVEKYVRAFKYPNSRLAQLCAPNKMASEGVDVVGTYGGQETDKFVGAVIETVNALVTNQGTDMMIPVKHRVTGNATMGDKALRGKAKVPSMGFRNIPVNRRRFSVAKPTGMEAQKVKDWAKWFINSCVPDLKEWWGSNYAKDIYHALFYGYSPEIIAGVDHGGRGLSMVSHPNMFISGSGRVSYPEGNTTWTNLPGTAAYEADVEAAIESLADPDTQGFDARFVRNLISMAPRCGVKEVSYKGGYSFYPIVCTQGQFNQFIQDEEVRDLLKSLNISSLANHPLANLDFIAFEKALIIPDIKMWTAYTHETDSDITDGTAAYGPRPTAGDIAEGFLVGDTIEQNDTGSNACCVLLGESALVTATAKDLTIEEQEDDFKNVHEYALDAIVSTIRVEEYDTIGQITGTVGNFVANQASLMGITRSQYTLDWVNQPVV